jgi:hypothetical protein
MSNEKNEKNEKKKRAPSPRDVWRLMMAVIGVVAVIQELRKPSQQRTWHGAVGVFPYDFRMPTVERLRNTYWNPDGPMISSKVFGVGWAPNFGVLTRFFVGSKK